MSNHLRVAYYGTENVAQTGLALNTSQRILSGRNCYELVNTTSQLALWAIKNCASYLLITGLTKKCLM